MPNNIPSLDEPGYPKPFNFSDARDYCGCRLTEPFLHFNRSHIFSLAEWDEEAQTCTLALAGSLTRLVNVPVSVVELTN